MKRLIACLIGLGFSLAIYGQNVPLVTKKVFLENATLHQRPGETPYVGNILIEDGIITQVGPNIQKPYDARVIAGDSLHIYAGFIASLSHVGLEKPKDDNSRPRVDRTGYPPNDVAGITPEVSISDLYKKSDRSITDMRKQGFGIAHTVPYGRMLPGMGSVISLGGDDFHQSVLAEDQTMYAQWATANRVFPATLIGIMAKWRELYKNAEFASNHNNSYKLNPQNRKRPDGDEATKALFPVTAGSMPVFFHAEKHRDIARTLQLQKDLGFQLILSEVKEGDRILDHIKGKSAQVLVSLDLPKEEKKGKDDKKEKSEDIKEGDKVKEALEARKKESAERYVSQSKIFSESGLPVAFSYIDVKAGDIHANIRRMISSGLSESDALAALTTQPANVLGISSIAGTIDRGKLANLVISTAPIFDEKAKIKMVLIDGKVHKYEVKEKKKKSSSDEAVDITGSWSYTIEIPGMTPSGNMKITGADDDYTIEITSNQAPGETMNAEGIEVDGNNVTFTFSVNADGARITVENDLTFDDDTFEGTVSIADFGSFEISGAKDESPE